MTPGRPIHSAGRRRGPTFALCRSRSERLKSRLRLSTPSTVFNAVFSFRFGWEGKMRPIESDIKASLQNPQIMGADNAEIAEKLDADAAGGGWLHNDSLWRTLLPRPKLKDP